MFQTACDANGVHERSEICLFQYFVHNNTKAALSDMKTTRVDRLKPKDFQLISYPEVDNYLLKTYETD